MKNHTQTKQTIKIANHVNRRSKTISQNTVSLHDKAQKKTGIERSYHNTIKATYKKPIASTTVNTEKQKTFHLISNEAESALMQYFKFQPEKEGKIKNKRDTIGKKEANLSKTAGKHELIFKGH